MGSILHLLLRQPDVRHKGFNKPSGELLGNFVDADKNLASAARGDGSGMDRTERGEGEVAGSTRTSFASWST